MAAARRLLADVPCDLLEEDFAELRDEELRDAAERPPEPEEEPRELDDDLLELEALRDEPDFRAAPPPPFFEELLLS